MSIKGVSEIRRLPRLGKIRLGIKVTEPNKNPYPRPTDYFVLPEEIKGILGEKPNKLRIMLPVEDPEIFAPQFLKAYSMSQGLVCRGDGVTATRKVDVETGDIANRNTETWELKEVTCDPNTCPESVGSRPQCRRVMNLLFVLPEVPGLGVWQLDTSSFFSIVNINSCIDVIRSLCGRISSIPLTLSLEPREVTPPGIKKKTVHVLHLRSNLRLAELQRLALKRPLALTMPAAEEEEPPDDLFPSEVLEEADKTAAKAEEQPTEGISIDLTWLDESKKALKWVDDTMKTFLVSKYKVSPQGTLTEVLNRLTREQAKDFVAQINKKLERQSGLF